MGIREYLQTALYLQAAVFRKGYDDFGFLRPVGQDLGGFLQYGVGVPSIEFA
jgi:hypothetical protein